MQNIDELLLFQPPDNVKHISLCSLPTGCGVGRGCYCSLARKGYAPFEGTNSYIHFFNPPR